MKIPKSPDFDIVSLRDHTIRLIVAYPGLSKSRGEHLLGLIENFGLHHRRTEVFIFSLPKLTGSFIQGIVECLEVIERKISRRAKKR